MYVSYFIKIPVANILWKRHKICSLRNETWVQHNFKMAPCKSNNAITYLSSLMIVIIRKAYKFVFNPFLSNAKFDVENLTEKLVS